MGNLPSKQPVQGNEFREVLSLIEAGRNRAYHAVNVSLINTYWQVGGYLSQKVQQAQWGRGVVQELAAWLAQQQPGLKGFSASNLWRMMQFFDTYATQEELAPLVREVDWSKHLILLGRCKTQEERSFYLQACYRANWSRRELERQINAGAFERSVLADKKLAPEALDRDHRRPRENPSIGVLLCQRKDDEVVEYALSRHLSPTLVAEYETRLLPKELLRQKLHEWREMLAQASDGDDAQGEMK